MSFLVATGATALGAGLSRADSSVGSISNYYFGGKSEKRSNERSEAMTERQRSEQFKYDLAEKNYDYALGKMAYDYSNSEEYRLAQEYAQNSAKWNVYGLRNAGLNPILAATDGNFRGTFGNTGAFSPSTSGGGGSSQFSSAGSRAGSSASPFDISEALRDINSARQTSVATDIAQDTKDSVVSQAKNNAVRSAFDAQNAQAVVSKTRAESNLINAEAVRTEAQARQLESSTALNLVQAENARKNEGVNSWPGAAYNISNKFLDLFKKNPYMLISPAAGLLHNFLFGGDENSAKRAAKNFEIYKSKIESYFDSPEIKLEDGSSKDKTIDTPVLVVPPATKKKRELEFYDDDKFIPRNSIIPRNSYYGLQPGYRSRS